MNKEQLKTQEEMILAIKEKKEDRIEEFVYETIRLIKEPNSDIQLQFLLYEVLFLYFAEKGKKFKGLLEKYTQFHTTLQSKNHPLVKLVSMYVYGAFPVIFKRGDEIFSTTVIDRMLMRHQPMKGKYDELVLFLLKESNMAPLYGTTGILYLGISTNKEDGRDQWYVGQTSQTWELRHCTIDSLYPSHCMDTGVAMFGFDRSLEGPLQTCDVQYARNGRHSTRFYLLWNVDKKELVERLGLSIKNSTLDEIKSAYSKALETCECYFINYLEYYTETNNLVRDLTKEEVEFAKSHKKSGKDRLSLMKFNSLNAQYEKNNTPSEFEKLNKAFESNFVVTEKVIKELSVKLKKSSLEEGSVLTQKDFAEKLSKLTGKPKSASEKHPLYIAWKNAKDKYKKNKKNLQLVLDYQSILGNVEKVTEFAKGNLVLEKTDIISLDNKIFK